jgi:membrane protease YdiL (CAAX protease family)
MHTNTVQEKLPLDYFLLVVALSIPFWVFGGSKLPLPINLPVSAVTTFVPAIAAGILTYRRAGSTGVKAFIKKAVDFKKVKNKIWYLPAIFLAPLIYLASYIVMRLTGLPLPEAIIIPPLMVPAFFIMFLIGDMGEELGWSGYAIDPMQKRWGAVKASLILGAFWAIYHSVTFVQTRHSVSWVVWQCIKTVAMRVVLVWIYNRTGKSVAATNLYHATDNVSAFLYPNFGSHYNPMVTGILTVVVAWLILPRMYTDKHRYEIRI